MSPSIIWFRKDLRISDNSALNSAVKKGFPVIPLYILDPKLIEREGYLRSKQVLLDSLHDLRKDIGKDGGDLLVRMGPPEKVMEDLVKQYGVKWIFFNRDYTPFALRRDGLVVERVKRLGAECMIGDDLLLVDLPSLKNQSGLPYSVFTPFFKRASSDRVSKPHTQKDIKYFKHGVDPKESSSLLDRIVDRRDQNVARGGRSIALQILDGMAQYEKYELERDYPALDATTHLSIHNKLGTVSIREVYYAISDRLSSSHPLIKQLYWREFAYYIAFHFPHMLVGNFKREYDRIEWSNNSEYIDAFKSGNTGFPIVDAGINELLSTGYMHNRVRMVCASFLTKDLHLDWRVGERFFAQNLVDYDPIVNRFNWQWVASTGADALPYFRIFNPWVQQRKFDKDAKYIKRWLPQLAQRPPKEIHSPKGIDGYIHPIVDHSVQSRLSVEMYR